MVAQVEERRRNYPDLILRLDRIEEKIDKVNSRIRNLEVWKGFITGGVGVIALVLAASAPVLVSAFINGQGG